MFAVVRKTLAEFSARPLKSYFRVGSWGFGVTFLGNLAWTSVDRDAPLSIVANPKLYSTSLLGKSAFAGFLWPAIPFRIYNSPRRFFCVGAGIQEGGRDMVNLVDGKIQMSRPDFEKLKRNYLTDMSAINNVLGSKLRDGTIVVKVDGEDVRDECLEVFDDPPPENQ